MYQSTQIKLKSGALLTGPDGIAKGEDALSLLENSQTRSQFIDELMEVRRLARATNKCEEFKSSLNQTVSFCALVGSVPVSATE